MKLEHLVAYVVADLRSPLFVLELLPAAKLEDALALPVGALFLAAPFIVLLNFGELHQLFTVVTLDLEQVDELLKDVRARTHPHRAGTLEGAAFLPLGDALFAE